MLRCRSIRCWKGLLDNGREWNCFCSNLNIWKEKKSPPESLLVYFMNVLKKLWFQRFLTPTLLSAKCNCFKTILLFPSFQISSFHWFYDYKTSFTAEHVSYLLSTMFSFFSTFKISSLMWKKANLHPAVVLFLFIVACILMHIIYSKKQHTETSVCVLWQQHS